MPTVKCLNDGCKFNCNGKCSEKKIELNYEGTCNNFSSKFTYFNNGILPEKYLEVINNSNNNNNNNSSKEKEKDRENIPKVEYGFISPSGKFFPGNFGEYSEIANKIISKNKWKKEFYSSSFNSSPNFLCYKKNYILLHNPRNPLANSIDNVIVTGNLEYATQHQADFLFDYFNKRKAPELALKYYQMCEREN